MKSYFSTTTLKMEEASFAILQKTKNTFQLSDPHMYFVNHMSAYEHSVMRKFGFEIAEKRTYELSQAAMFSECANLSVTSVSSISSYVSFIPFYGGRPPDVDKDLKVRSIGQGNSLVSASTKAMQCAASVCSTLKYFGGKTVIGVSNDRDMAILRKTVCYCLSHSTTLVFVLIFVD